MAKNTSIILGDHFDKFVQSEIKFGRYTSASEVLKSGLRLLEIEISKIEAINKAIIISDESGKPYSSNNESFKKRMRKKFNLNA